MPIRRRRRPMRTSCCPGNATRRRSVSSCPTCGLESDTTKRESGSAKATPGSSANASTVTATVMRRLDRPPAVRLARASMRRAHSSSLRAGMCETYPATVARGGSGQTVKGRPAAVPRRSRTRQASIRMTAKTVAERTVGPDRRRVVAERRRGGAEPLPDRRALLAGRHPGRRALRLRGVVRGVPVGARHVRGVREVGELDRRAGRRDPAAQAALVPLPHGVEDARARAGAAVDRGHGAPRHAVGDVDELVDDVHARSVIYNHSCATTVVEFLRIGGRHRSGEARRRARGRLAAGLALGAEVLRRLRAAGSPTCARATGSSSSTWSPGRWRSARSPAAWASPSRPPRRPPRARGARLSRPLADATDGRVRLGALAPRGAARCGRRSPRIWPLARGGGARWRPCARR